MLLKVIINARFIALRRDFRRETSAENGLRKRMDVDCNDVKACHLFARRNKHIADVHLSHTQRKKSYFHSSWEAYVSFNFVCFFFFQKLASYVSLSLSHTVMTCKNVIRKIGHVRIIWPAPRKIRITLTTYRQ